MSQYHESFHLGILLINLLEYIAVLLLLSRKFTALMASYSDEIYYYSDDDYVCVLFKVSAGGNVSL